MTELAGLSLLHDGARRLGLADLAGLDSAAADFLATPGARPSVGEFVRWLAAAPDAGHLARHLGYLLDARPDIGGRFPEARSGCLHRFSVWLRGQGAHVAANAMLGDTSVRATEVRRTGADSEGVDVVGAFDSPAGLGEAARRRMESLRRAGVKVSPVGYPVVPSPPGCAVGGSASHDVVVACVNPEHLVAARHDLGSDLFDGRYVVGQWFWELETFPPWYRPAYRFVDEVWMATSYMADNARRELPERIEVRHIPLPVTTPRFDPSVTRAELAMTGEFVFLVMFDFLSVMKRKNPLGAVEAYRRAFPAPDGTQLIIKSVNGSHRPADLERLRRVCADRNDIVLVDESMESERSNAMLALADCLVSLHRSEGLGLTVAEALSLGTPVICTGYGGVTDLLPDGYAYAVRHDRTRVGPDAEGYDRESWWAEPDVAHAAHLMRDIVTRVEEAHAWVNTARETSLAALAPGRIQELVAERLKEIRLMRTDGAR